MSAAFAVSMATLGRPTISASMPRASAAAVVSAARRPVRAATGTAGTSTTGLLTRARSVPTRGMASRSSVLAPGGNRAALTRRHSATPTRRVGTRMMTMDPMGEVASKAIAANNVMVFSATYCPYCTRVKALFTELGVEHRVWELDQMVGGDEIKAWLQQKTGQRTIPNVFIKGEHVGGCDDVFALNAAGKLRF